jgi:putative DNA-invertase from lambdoid prophage Rac
VQFKLALGLIGQTVREAEKAAEADYKEHKKRTIGIAAEAGARGQAVRKRTIADSPQSYVQNIALQCFGRGALTDISYGQDFPPMPRTFAYVRVSTVGQTTENQIREIEAAGFAVTPRRVVSETVSGSSAIAQRPGFMRLVDKLEQDDVLIVTKLDRLGRNAMDVAATVDRLAKAGVRVHCLALGGVDLTSPAGRMTMGVINAVAQFERDLLIERTQSGLQRAKAEGAVFGRPATLDADQRESVQAGLAAGVSVSELAKRYSTSRQTIMRVRDAAAGPPVRRAA